MNEFTLGEDVRKSQQPSQYKLIEITSRRAKPGVHYYYVYVKEDRKPLASICEQDGLFYNNNVDPEHRSPFASLLKACKSINPRGIFRLKTILWVLLKERPDFIPPVNN
jgi:hypothetical protein